MKTTTTTATLKRIFTFEAISMISTIILTAISTFLGALSFDIAHEPLLNYNQLPAEDIFRWWKHWIIEFIPYLIAIAVFVAIIAALVPGIMKYTKSYSLFALIPMSIMTLIIAFYTANEYSYILDGITIGLWFEIFGNFLGISFCIIAVVVGIVAVIANVYFRRKAKS